jgi:hypothetical protein
MGNIAAMWTLPLRARNIKGKKVEARLVSPNGARFA